MEVTSVCEDISAAYEALASLRARLTEIGTGEFSSENPTILLNLLAEMVNSLETSLFWRYAERARILAREDPGPKAERDLHRLELRVSAVVEAVARLTPIIKFVDGARAQINPWGLVSQIERLCGCVADRSSVIVRPRWEYNYTYFPIDTLLKLIVGKIEDFDLELHDALFSFFRTFPRFFALSFPPTQVDNVLQIAIWAHELGHFMDNLEGETRTGNVGVFVSDELMRNLTIIITPDERRQISDLFFAGRDLDHPAVRQDFDQVCERIILPIVQMVRGWSREIFADVFSIQLFGPAALFGFCDLALVLFPDLDAVSDSEHPPLRQRLSVLLTELERWSAGENWTSYLPDREREAVEKQLASLRSRLELPRRERWLIPGLSGAETELLRIRTQIVERVVGEVADAVRDQMDRIVNTLSAKGCYLRPADLKDVGRSVRLLEDSIPPTLQDPAAIDESFRAQLQLARCINAGWFYWLGRRQYPSEVSDRIYRQLKDDRDDLNRILLKSVELTEAQQWFFERRSEVVEPSVRIAHPRHDVPGQSRGHAPILGGVLGKKEVWQYLREGRLTLVPLLDAEEQLDEAAIDVRLGNEFIATRHTRLQALDPSDQQTGTQIAEFQTKLYVPFGRPYVLHPRQFVLGSTLEYIALPDDLTGLVVGRSSWGRLGLIIATAIKVDPGFKGTLTLELVNLGNTPILLYPCSRIAQLMLYHVARSQDKDGS
jgi:dCTP deaminase